MAPAAALSSSRAWVLRLESTRMSSNDPMNDDKLIHAVRQRAEDRRTRTDYSDRSCPDLAPPAPAQALIDAEAALGFQLHPFHRRLLMEVGNGGFGPGDGLIGLSGGR